MCIFKTLGKIWSCNQATVKGITRSADDMNAEYGRQLKIAKIVKSKCGRWLMVIRCYILASHKSKFSTEEFSVMSKAAMISTSLKYVILWIGLYITVTNKLKINFITSH
jgi:hypothetical protein